MPEENTSDGSLERSTANASVSGGESGASLLTAELNPSEAAEKGNEGKDSVPLDPFRFVPSTPDQYKLDVDQDVQVDTALLGDFKATAHELGINQGQAQKLVDLYAKHSVASSNKTAEAQIAEVIRAKQDWESEITSRPRFQEEVVDARRTLKEFGSPELNEIMDSSLLGSHPVFFDFIVNVGKALAEPTTRGNGGLAREQEKPLMDRLWPGMK